MSRPWLLNQHPLTPARSPTGYARISRRWRGWQRGSPRNADRDDVVQEALARAWSKRRQYDPQRGTPSAWLLAITADQARKTLRRRRPLLSLTDAQRVADRPDRPDDRLDVERAVRRLAPKQRLAVDCFYFVGLTVAEIAAVMRCAEGTVKSTLADARARLRVLLEVSG